MTVTPDWRPVARKDASRDEWARIVTEKMGPCRVSGDLHGIDYAHYVSRSQRGDDVPANIFPLSHDLHMRYHDRSPGWEEIAAAIRHSMTPVEKAYVIAKKSRAWLDRMYPPGDLDLCAKCRKPLRSKITREPARKRKYWKLLVPADCEDGAVVLDSLVESAREKIGRAVGTPEYYSLCEALAVFCRDAVSEDAA